MLLPLFAAPSRRSWGIGEFADIPVFCSWLREAGFDFLQVLPFNEMPADQHSPYAAISAMALDPIYISVWAVDEFLAAGGESTLSADARKRLAAVRASGRIDYETVRALKLAALRTAFTRFLDGEWRLITPRAQALRDYLERERWWVADYVLYRALRDRYRCAPWWEWDEELARRDPAALEHARASLSDELMFHSYVQWLADQQWRAAHAAAAPVGIFGDLPFVVGRDSADVWANQQAFRFDATVGAPPDAFSETGQDWGLPVYRWDVFANENDAWIRARGRRNADLFDGYRVDHLVGFYRTYVIPREGGERTFVPPDEPSQKAQGERVMQVFQGSGACVIAEDLGTVPDFVRASLSGLQIPGYKVLRWEREWHVAGQPFKNPQEYPTRSVATTGTHDTETLIEWWESAPREEREALAHLPFLAERAPRPKSCTDESGPGDSSAADQTVCDRQTRDAILELLIASASDFVIFPVQDVFGWRERINVPATVTDENWTWRLPWPVDEMSLLPEVRARAALLRRWMREYRRAEPTGEDGIPEEGLEDAGPRAPVDHFRFVTGSNS
jgi:4-alpha-glucanotransferase